MRLRYRFVNSVTIAMVLLWPGQVVQAQDTTVTAFVNANVVSMRSTAIDRGQTVLVRNSRIFSIGPTASARVPAGARRIDATGKYLMPGLTEMHGHTVGTIASARAELDMMFLYAANGVTTVRGMLGLPRQLALRELSNSGSIFGPTLYLAGPSFNNNTISSPSQADVRVRLQKEQGWDLLKIHPGLTIPQYDAMALAASEVGIRFGGHVPADVGFEHALQMGQETFDHMDGILEYLDAIDKPLDESKLPSLIRMMRDADAAVVPTMVLWEVGVIGIGDPDTLSQFPELRYWPRANEPGVPTTNGWIQAMRNRRPENPAQAAIHARNRERLLKALSDGGVTILMGTDSPQIFSVPGFSLHREMEAMARAGMTPYEILVSGTRNVGEYFQREDSFGTVAVSKRADLILLNSNPLEDVSNVSDRVGVMIRGRWMSEEDIQAELDRIAQRFGATD